MTGYEKIKRLAKEKKCNVTDLLVLARQNDPFYTGSATQKAMAEWFAELWRSFGYTAGVHLRRVHYQLVSQEDPKKHNGKPYKNTENDWNYLCNAGKYARCLGLVDPAAFVDRRNPDPHIFNEYMMYTQKQEWGCDFPVWWMPEIKIDLAGDLSWTLPRFWVSGYDYSDSLQPYHLEVWVEKSTMDDVLIPLCRQYGVNLVTGVGFMSITSVIDLLKRINETGKPGRIFYISDFDPAGARMPTSVARQIEYWLADYAAKADVKLSHIVLTKEQVERYRLPRIPIKDSDKRKANFEDRYGEGAVELDALEALHPGELASIVEENILRFWDSELEEKLAEAKRKAKEELYKHWQAKIGPFQEDLDDLKAQIEDITQKYQLRLEEMRKELEDELEPYGEAINSLRHAIQNVIDDITPNLPELPEPEIEEADTYWLFDSYRDYFEQLAAYQAWQSGQAEKAS